MKELLLKIMVQMSLKGGATLEKNVWYSLN